MANYTSISQYDAQPSGYPSSQGTQRSYWQGRNDPPMRTSLNLQQFTFWDGFVLAGGCHPSLLKSIQELDKVLRAYNYHIRSAWCWNRRSIRGSSTQWSTHSTGTSIDLNPAENPMSKNFRSDMSPAMVRDILNIRMADGTRVWRWGGYFRTHDAMHFETAINFLQSIKYSQENSPSVAVSAPTQQTSTVAPVAAPKVSEGLTVEEKKQLEFLLALVGSQPTEDVINALYRNVFDGRDADPTGLSYWSEMHDKKNVSFYEIWGHLRAAAGK